MRERLTSSRAAVVSMVVAVVLVAVAMILPLVVDEDVRVHFAPLHAWWNPEIGWLTVPAVLIGFTLAFTLPRLSQRTSWRGSLLLAYGATWLWTMALAFTDGPHGLYRVFDRKAEYVYDAQRVKAIVPMLHDFISRIPADAPDKWQTHVAGHPPGALLFFVLLDRLGITSSFWIGVVVVTLGATFVVAVMLTLRTLGSEDVARRAVPWIALAPSAVWFGVNGDAIFTAVAAWGLCLLAFATHGGRRSVPLALGAGLLLGFCIFLSYGLVLLGVLAVAVLWIGRSWRPLLWAAAAAVVVTLVFALLGFAWWEAYPVLRERYYAGIASERHYAYWVWANIAAWTFTVGVAVWAAFPRTWLAARGQEEDSVGSRDRTVLARLAAAALVTIVLATLSGMSKAEVERIWLPFTAWVVAIPLLLPERWHRPLLVSQVVLALVVETLLATRW